MTDALSVGLYTDALGDLGADEAFAWAAERGILELEIGTGAFSSAPHADLAELGTDAGAERLLRRAREAGVRIAALNCSGNPLHPDPARGPADDAALRATLAAAARLGVPKVVCMSGCPGGGPDDRSGPTFLPTEWLDDVVGVSDWQWRERLVPYWEELAAHAAGHAPGVAICLELHPGAAVYNLRTFGRLRDALGGVVSVNLDPSHLFWQGMDALATARALGPAVGHAHGKDTMVDPEAVARDGLLEGASAWRFVTVGRGHGEEWWTAFCRALLDAGYRGPVSVEWEDEAVEPRASIEESAGVLRRSIEAAV